MPPQPIGRRPVHRPLIRAQLPRVEGLKLERQAPDFTDPPEPPAAATAHFRGGGVRRRVAAAATASASAAWCRIAAGGGGGGGRGAGQGFGRGPGGAATSRVTAAADAQRGRLTVCGRVQQRSQLVAAAASWQLQARQAGNVHGRCLLSAGKTGLIVGVANKRSIAWAIAQAASAAGARLALTYQDERLEENVRELAPKASPIRCSCRCDVTDDAQIARGVRRRSTQKFGGLDFRRPRRGVRAARGSVEAVRRRRRATASGRRSTSARYSLIALARGALPLMERRGGGSILTLTYLGSERVFQNYNVMGVAKAALESSVRYLAADLGPKNIRVNAISAGPIKTLAASRHLGLLEHPAGVSRSRAAAPHASTPREVADARDVPAERRRPRRDRRKC